jgi:hypothetical protein
MPAVRLELDVADLILMRDALRERAEDAPTRALLERLNREIETQSRPGPPRFGSIRPPVPQPAG